MTYSNIIEKLKSEGRDTCEVEAMMDAFKEASSYNDIEYCQNQLYGVLVGLTIMGYIELDQLAEITDELEQGNF